MERVFASSVSSAHPKPQALASRFNSVLRKRGILKPAQKVYASLSLSLSLSLTDADLEKTRDAIADASEALREA
jgi:hypothetical protein